MHHNEKPNAKKWCEYVGITSGETEENTTYSPVMIVKCFKHKHGFTVRRDIRDDSINISTHDAMVEVQKRCEIEMLSKVKCPRCQSDEVVKHGMSIKGEQRYRCRYYACEGRTFMLEYFHKAYYRKLYKDNVKGAEEIG